MPRRMVKLFIRRSCSCCRNCIRQGATIAMVTHDPRYARHADRSIHLFDGRIVEENVPETV